MKASELREQSVEELRIRLEELEEESFNLRFQHTLGQLSSPIRLRDVRRDIARVRTLLHESTTGLRTLPGAEAEAQPADA
jgi:large subunit ribosomal protein L29